MMNQLKTQIISLLNNQTSWTSASYIADKLSVSTRNIKYKIAEINDEFTDLITSSNRGYIIDKDKAKVILETNDTNSIPQNYNERKRYVITTLLLEKQHKTISDFSDYFCISPVTFQKELAKIRSELAQYHLLVHIKNDVVTISGIDKDKRAVMLSLINDEIKESYFSLDMIQNIFTSVSLSEIKEIVTSIIGKHQYFLDDYSLLNYVLHLALTIELRNGEEAYYEIVNNLSSIVQLADRHTINIVNDIYTSLKKKYNTNYTIDDIYQASVLMMTRVQNTSLEGLSFNQMENLVGSDVSHLLNEIVSSVENTYSIKLNDENFLVRFGFHLKNLLIRLKNNISITNLQFDSIKNTYPMIYAISVHISNIISKHYGYTLPEDEIAYITLHIGIMIEENNAVKDRINTIIICPDYNGIGKKLYSKLSGIFSESMLIVNLATAISKDLDLSKADLIITTEQIDSTLSIMQLKIEPFITERNIRDIFNCIDDLKSKKVKNVMKEKILYFFRKDLFFANEPFKIDKDAIEKMCDVMISKQYVEKTYKQQIYEHEEIAPSSYGAIAIPHPLNNDAKSSVISVAINSNPIDWGINKVNIVFMLSLTQEDKELFQDIFRFITRLLNNESATKKLLSVNSFEEFINCLLSFY